MRYNLTLLSLPPEIRRMVYRAILVADHNSEHWEWNLASLDAFNRRHGIIRVNSQLRQETQIYFYGSIPWQIRIDCFPRESWMRPERRKTLRILKTLSGWTSRMYIRELSLLFVIDQLVGSESEELSETLEFVDTVCGYFSTVQRLNIAWCDHFMRLGWDEKESTLLKPLANFQAGCSIAILEGHYQNSQKTREEFANCVDDIINGPGKAFSSLCSNPVRGPK
ncbi:MAG: hypothetical protein HETSPECPRED_009606 [Heterodermia speciosa]|uniref:Uncharacterized protein n=1 Tax=Heterodermia speciosa TaxID=116794 RepID=A0A8H3ER11_9LECA|nr:MAG: hypothetical protein HETSPECPRED_009606 [Heterodermia speciosa]